MPSPETSRQLTPDGLSGVYPSCFSCGISAGVSGKLTLVVTYIFAFHGMAPTCIPNKLKGAPVRST
jgi:hypothetical protein